MCITCTKKGVKQLQFGAVLKKMRKGAGFSQEDMAERLHMSRSNVSRLESNKLELKAADLINWCKQTQAHDLLIAFIYNTDAVSAVQQLSQLITGTILRFGGLI